MSLLVFFPLTAVLHHAVFYRPTCILNHFGEDYYPAVVLDWLTRDPSPWIAAVLTAALWFAARRWRWLNRWSLAFVLAFLPLTIWIWDIPFSGRVICDLGHDGRWPIRTLYLYAFGLVALVGYALVRAVKKP